MPARLRPIRRREAGGALPQSCQLSPLLQRVYRQRPLQSPEELDLALSRLAPPQQMLGMEDAVLRLLHARSAQERVLIVGDFDADGATSSALAVAALRELGFAQVDYLVPNRFEYGYGLTPEIVALSRERAPDLIVTVDNGISSLAGAEAVAAAGMDLLITDHHLPGERLPDPALILNPNQPGCPFPSKNLAGVGVIFYLLLALRAALREQGAFAGEGAAEPKLGAYLDLVALGTVADVVTLDHNNRILVQGGLERLRAGRGRPGIVALAEVAGRDLSRLCAADLAFALGPRLNAAGRLDDMSLGIECLLSTDAERARSLAQQLDSMNRERQQIERTMEAEALQALAQLSLDYSNPPPALVLHDPRWHQGVVGILASRIKERFHRPVIAFAEVGSGELKGSGRGIDGLHLRDLLALVDARHPGLLGRFGGHAMAAGLSLPSAHLAPFETAFLEAVEEQAAGQVLEALCETDGPLRPEEFSLENAELLRFAGPWGQHFPEPLFDGEFELLAQRLVGERHLKMRLCPADGGDEIDAIAFRVDTDRWPAPEVRRVRAAYRLDVNEWRGRRSLQLLVEQLEAL